MKHPDLVILYVDSPAASADFYRRILGAEPVEASPTFAMFVLATGLKFGLWSRHAVSPAATVAGGGGEIGILLGTPGEVDAAHDQWKTQGVNIAQGVADMEFGRNFLALDPDGHRLRVYAIPA